MRLVTACLLSAMTVGTIAEISSQGGAADISAMSEEEIEALSAADRINAEELQESEESNQDEDAGAASLTRSGPGGWDYCKTNECQEGQGDCDSNRECAKGLVCGRNNCNPKLGFHPLTDCCEKLKPFHRDYCKMMDCGLGEGDCDCHEQCGPGLKCGVDNCRKMHPGVSGIPKWADCCTRCSSVKVGPPGMRTTVEAANWDVDKKVVGTGRTLIKPPTVLEDAAVWSLPALAPSDEIKIKCCRYGKKKCEFFITVYLCKPCSEHHNGDLPAHLLSAGWDAGSCSPRFTLPGDMSGASHGMATFHRTLYPGEGEVIPITKNAPHVAVFERTGLIIGPWCTKPTGPFPSPGGPSGSACTCIPGLLI